MNIDDIRLTPEELEAATIPVLKTFAHVPLREMGLEGLFQLEISEAITNAATDKAIEKITAGLDTLSVETKDDWEFLAKVGEYLKSLRELVKK